MRYVVHFSCGAASAVAARLAVLTLRPVVVVNALVAEEHGDNQRFLGDVEKWIGVPVVRLRDEKYGASAYEVFRRSRYTKGMYGAPCTKKIKRDILDTWGHPGDVPILGYTAEEQDRADRFLDSHGGVGVFPLIDRGLSKADCLAMVERAGIVLPAMYRLGYPNANCIGCVKGGAGYWNKIRRDFPERFEEMAQIEETIGPSAYLMRDRKTGVRISLRQLDPNVGRNSAAVPECGFACDRAEESLNALDGQEGKE